MDKRIYDLYYPSVIQILDCFANNTHVKHYTWGLPSYATKKDAVILANKFRQLAFKVTLGEATAMGNQFGIPPTNFFVLRISEA